MTTLNTIGILPRKVSRMEGSGAWRMSDRRCIISRILSALFPHPLSKPNPCNLRSNFEVEIYESKRKMLKRIIERCWWWCWLVLKLGVGCIRWKLWKIILCFDHRRLKSSHGVYPVIQHHHMSIVSVCAKEIKEWFQTIFAAEHAWREVSVEELDSIANWRRTSWSRKCRIEWLKIKLKHIRVIIPVINKLNLWKNYLKTETIWKWKWRQLTAQQVLPWTRDILKHSAAQHSVDMHPHARTPKHQVVDEQLKLQMEEILCLPIIPQNRKGINNQYHGKGELQYKMLTWKKKKAVV